MIDVLVGPTEKLFRVHKQIICQKIPFFYSMFNGAWKQPGQTSVTLPEDSPPEFGLLLGWIYQSSVRPLTVEPGRIQCSYNEFKFYALADKYCLPELKNDIMDMLISYFDKSSQLPAPSMILSVYANMPDGSPLRKLMAYSLNFILHNRDSIKSVGTMTLSECMGADEGLRTDVIRLMESDVVDPRSLPRETFHCQH